MVGRKTDLDAGFQRFAELTKSVSGKLPGSRGSPARWVLRSIHLIDVPSRDGKRIPAGLATSAAAFKLISPRTTASASINPVKTLLTDPIS